MIRLRQLTAMLMIGVALSGCSVLNRGGKKKTPVIGERIAILSTESDISVDEATAAIPMSLPAATANTEWAQPGGLASKAPGNLALGASLGQVWNVSIGAGDKKGARLAAAPVVAGGKVYTIDTASTVRAFDERNGAQLWASQFGTEARGAPSLFGGGVAVDGGRLFATNGLGFVAALDAGTGAKVWQVRPGGPLRGAPTVVNSTLYVMSQDNQIFSLKQVDGATNWSNAAALEIAGIFGTSAPAVAQGTVVAGFSSGELNAYRYENGRMVWQDTLARTGIRTSVSSLSDVDADPVIDNGQVFALGQGGRMVSLDLVSGQRIWELNLAGISTPCVVGDWVFLVTDEAKVVAVARATGKVRWIAQLPRYKSAKSKKGYVGYEGPVMAGERLILTGSNGTLININPANGSFQSQTNAGGPVSLPPVVANKTLYVLTDNGRLAAYR
ncbi:PQQ-binding-like beta-propeller repeat protein [Sphingomonas sp.]|uniref:outer membrane protein assembly factor BamB family protein n=1 Tax=Sphingomonas sp. TaxID=28214 RepID=UPI00286BDBF9|nr:PQQ-binding-like beta-propeller repeat protein [Sphingomonas sp.]